MTDANGECRFLQIGAMTMSLALVMALVIWLSPKKVVMAHEGIFFSAYSLLATCSLALLSLSAMSLFLSTKEFRIASIFTLIGTLSTLFFWAAWVLNALHSPWYIFFAWGATIISYPDEIVQHALGMDIVYMHHSHLAKHDILKRWSIFISSTVSIWSVIGCLAGLLKRKVTRPQRL